MIIDERHFLHRFSFLLGVDIFHGCFCLYAFVLICEVLNSSGFFFNEAEINQIKVMLCLRFNSFNEYLWLNKKQTKT